MSDESTIDMTVEEVCKLLDEQQGSAGISDTCEMLHIERVFFYTAEEDEQDDQCQWAYAWICSECHKPVLGIVSPRGILKPHYCPNCGKKVEPEWAREYRVEVGEFPEISVTPDSLYVL